MRPGLPPSQPMTQARFFDWAQQREREGDLAHYELLNGRVVMNPPPGYPHGEVEANLVTAIRTFVAGRKLGRVFASSQGFELPTGDTVEPDLAFVTHERWRAQPAPEPGKYVRAVPALIVEILSPGNQRRDLEEKRACYERSGIAEYWQVDCRLRQVTILRLVDGRYQSHLFTGSDRIESEVLIGLELRVDELFPEP